MANDYEKRLIRVWDHIHDNPAGDLSLDALADVAALSRFHFSRVFHAMTGQTVAQAVRRLRLYRASVALVTGKAPVAELARAVGYDNVNAFTRAFTDAFTLTPSAFRKRGELRPTNPEFRPKGPQMYPTEIRQDPARRLGALPHRGPYNEIGRAYAKLGAVLGTRGLWPQAGAMVAVYYDDPDATPPAELRAHAGVAFGPDAALDPPLEVVHLPGGPHAVMTYRGPYAGLGAAYGLLFGQWLPASGREPADSPVFEIYLNSPMDTAPEDLLTEICVPLKG
jgi:AraC family transcriptional regulator